VILARPARSFGQVVLEVRVAAADFEHALECAVGQRSAAEVRVHDHAGGVHDAAQGRRTRRRELRFEAGREVAGVDSRLDLLTGPGEHRPRGWHRERVTD